MAQVVWCKFCGKATYVPDQVLQMKCIDCGGVVAALGPSEVAPGEQLYDCDKCGEKYAVSDLRPVGRLILCRPCQLKEEAQAANAKPAGRVPAAPKRGAISGGGSRPVRPTKPSVLVVSPSVRVEAVREEVQAERSVFEVEMEAVQVTGKRANAAGKKVGKVEQGKRRYWGVPRWVVFNGIGLLLTFSVTVGWFFFQDSAITDLIDAATTQAEHKDVVATCEAYGKLYRYTKENQIPRLSAAKVDRAMGQWRDVSDQVIAGGNAMYYSGNVPAACDLYAQLDAIRAAGNLHPDMKVVAENTIGQWADLFLKVIQSADKALAARDVQGANRRYQILYEVIEKCKWPASIGPEIKRAMADWGKMYMDILKEGDQLYKAGKYREADEKYGLIEGLAKGHKVPAEVGKEVQRGIMTHQQLIKALAAQEAAAKKQVQEENQAAPGQ